MGLMLNLFTSAWNLLETTFRGLSDASKGLVMFILIIGAMVTFVYAVRGAKDGKMVKNWFMFFVCILLTVLAILFSFFIF